MSSPAAQRVHPDRAVLELAELVATGVLDRLPADTLAALPVSAAAPVDLEDAEGTPVATVSADGRVEPLRAFAHPPLRTHRRAPAQLRQTQPGHNQPGHDRPGGALVVAVTGPMTTEQVEAAVELATVSAVPLLWLAVVGAGRGRVAAGELPAGALWRAVTTLAERSGGTALPVALPAGRDDLLPAVAKAYGGTRLIGVDPGQNPGQNPGGNQAEPHPVFAEALARSVRPPASRGVVVLFTGLSGSGKSTVAKALAERVETASARTLTLLDGDEVRRLLSHGLGFSRADRDLNIRRIGYVAAEAARHGGLAVCAPIAPFAAVRAEMRAMAQDAGADFVLVHVATPLAECERRDRKGLYAKARAGELPEFTGISSPYEEPTDADLVLDTTDRPVAACVDQVWALLVERGYLSS